MTDPLVSICITSYQQRDLIAATVRSALDQAHPRVEVVVVDDGSTDGSGDELERFGDRITLVRQPNRGQRLALSEAVSRARGEWVLLLDGDDQLEPHAVTAALAAAPPGAVKVHWRMQLVDPAGALLGTNPSPQLRLATGDVASEVATTGWYSTVPTSGNLWARRALDALLPIPEDFDIAPDGYLNLGVAFLGPIGAVEAPLTRYLVHSANIFATVGTISAAQLRRRLAHAEALDRWLPRLAERGGYRARPGTVLGHPDFRLMRQLVEELDAGPGRGPWAARLGRAARGAGSAVASARTPGMRTRRRILCGALGPTLPLLPLPAVEHVRDVAFAGKPMRPRPS